MSPPQATMLLSMPRLLVLAFFTTIFISGVCTTFYPAPEIYPDEDELVLEDGAPLNLTCRAAHPVAWCTDNELTSNHYEEIFEEDHEKPYVSILMLDAVNYTHVGYLSCVYNTTENKEARNCNVSDPSISSVYLFVKDPNHLLVPGIDFLHAIIGESIVIPCKPTFPEVNVTVYKYRDDIDVDYDPRRGYTIQQPTVKDNEGTHICVGSYRGITENTIFFLKVLGKRNKPEQPSVDATGVWQEDRRSESLVFTYYVEEGSTVNLTCTTPSEGTSSGLVLKWSHNTMNMNKTGTHKVYRQTNRNLPNMGRHYEISNATLADSGIYKCWAERYRISSESSSLNLTVVAQSDTYLNMSIFEPNVTKHENTRVLWEILCITHPKPVFRWKKGAITLIDTSNDRLTEPKRYEMDIKRLVEGTISLFLHNPTLPDNGRYTLEAFFPNTNIKKTITMYLLIPGKPQSIMLESSKRQRMYKEGENFSLTCTAEGYPKPDVFLQFTPWGSNAAVTSEERRTYNDIGEGKISDNEENVVKRNVHWIGRAKEPGYYRCIASNEQDNGTSLIHNFIVTDGDDQMVISVKAETGDGMQGAAGQDMVVVEGDNITLTCRANKMLTKAPIIWTIDDDPLNKILQDQWDMEVISDESRLSRVSTVRVRNLTQIGPHNITCGDGHNNNSIMVRVQSKMQPQWVNGEPKARDITRKKNENVTLTCPAKGVPTPEVVWFKDGRILKADKFYVMSGYELRIPILVLDNEGSYRCEVSNRAGKLSADFSVTVTDPNDQVTAIILGVVGVLIAALVVLTVFFCKKIYQARKETLNLQLREQQLFNEGDPDSLSPELPLEQQAELLPYNTKYEVSRDSIIYDKLLGAGAFGRVYRAKAINLVPGQARTTVAVKMMKSRTDCAQLKALRSEVKIMIHIGRHINIVNLLGACSKDLASKGELLLLVEYCKHGNILEYMRRHRREFVNQINDEDKIDPTFEARRRNRCDSGSRNRASRCTLKYAHLNFHQDNVFYGSEPGNAPSAPQTPLRSPGEASLAHPIRARTLSSSSSNHVASDNSLLPSEASNGTTDDYLSAQNMSVSQAPLCSTDILCWGYQIAKGMEYLAFKKVLHGDLAARNVLLAENNVVKISDFGLAKDIYKNDNYKKKSDGPVPVKWLALECLRDGVFSTQSDVWSFGVVMWEIFSLGQVPYSCIEYDEKFVLKLEKGQRLEQPRYSTYELYRLMLDCWQEDPLQRPSFTSLENSLGEMVGEAQKQNYLQLMEPYQDNNSSEFLDLLPSQDYSAKVREAVRIVDEDGYEMPFSPGACGVAPQLLVQGDRLTARQVEFLHGGATMDSEHSIYMPMSSPDRTDTHTVFDFDNETVACIIERDGGKLPDSRPSQQQQDEPDSGGEDLYLKMDKTPQCSPMPDTPSAVPPTREISPQPLSLQNVPVTRRNKQSLPLSKDQHLPLKKHDSGVYSPTVLMQTNPSYMTTHTGPATDNYVNQKVSQNSPTYMNYDAVKAATSPSKRDYQDGGKCDEEYVSLLPKEAIRDRTVSETSSGLGSLADSPPQSMRGTLDSMKSSLMQSSIQEEVLAV